MSVTVAQVSDEQRHLEQIERLIHSHTLRKAESLCKLLRYLADYAISHPGVPVKEYQIATEVFGRPPSFDPQADSAVRVQAGRLRLKLAEYYNHEGLANDTVVEMPTGSYALSFHYRETPVLVLADAQSRMLDTAKIGTPSRHARGQAIVMAALAVALAFALGVIGTLVIAPRLPRTEKQSLSAYPALRDFWTQFISSPEAPWIVFSNAAFVGRPETGMRYLNPAHDSGEVILDHYTGVGEVLAVHELDRVFNLLDHPIRVKRGSLFSLDDAKNNDLIFVGSPAENLTLLDLPGTQEFQFKRLDSGPHKGELGIFSAHPARGEPAAFYPTNPSQSLVEDYAIVAVVHGLKTARHMMILAGTTTLGTQAAVEYVCAKDSLEELLRTIGVPVGGEVKPFEALLRVKVARGVPVSVQLVAVRQRK